MTTSTSAFIRSLTDNITPKYSHFGTIAHMSVLTATIDRALDCRTVAEIGS